MLWFKKLTKDKKRKKKNLEEREKPKKSNKRESKRELHSERDTELVYLRNKFKKNLWALPNKKITAKK